VNEDRTYRCLGCLDGVVTRRFDVSHVSTTCPACDSFERLVNEAVVDQLRAFEDDPPESLDWDALERTEKFLVAERVARRGREIAEFSTGEE
jgi:hypothetical protein